MSLVTVNVFTAGSDERRPGWEQDPRRFAFAINDPIDLYQRNWKNYFEFQAYNAPVANTFQIFLQEAGDPHRFWVNKTDGSAQGWTPKYTFWAFDRPTPGTTAYYVYHAINAGGPARMEISGSPKPYPGWERLFTFFAFPAAQGPAAPVFPVHCFVAGDDSQAASGNPRRTVIFTGAEAASMPSKGWTKVHDFQGLSAPQANTFQLFVRDTPHPIPQCIITRQAAPPGFRDVLTFFAFDKQAPGTVAFWVLSAGGSGPSDPLRTEVTGACVPIRPGWRHTDTFYAYPRAVGRCLTTVYVFEAHDQFRRFAYSTDGCDLATKNWRPSFAFDAPNVALPGTFPIFVAEHGVPVHRFYTERKPGASEGWNDLFSFYGYTSPVEGTVAFYVMDIGDGTNENPVRHEITTNPTPHPGWRMRFSFYAYPRHPDQPPANPY